MKTDVVSLKYLARSPFRMGGEELADVAADAQDRARADAGAIAAPWASCSNVNLEREKTNARSNRFPKESLADSGKGNP
jgi:hypothetical protein